MLAAAAAAWVLWAFEPHGQFFYPRCWLYTHTGLQCPGCGGLRAAHALLHGDVAAAWHLNPFAVLLAPLGAWWSAAEIARSFTGRKWPHPFYSGRFWMALGAAATVFGAARNLILFI